MEILKIESLLKQKQSYLTKVSSEIEVKLEEQKSLSEEIKLLKLKEQNLKDQIKKLTSEGNTVVVSEHAILRYLERVYGIDIEKVKNEILTEEFISMVRILENGIFPINPLAKAVVKNNVVITVKSNE